MSARHASPRAFYVSVRHPSGAAILALGPFERHAKALGLVESVRHLIGFRADLDRWCEYGYGTCSVPVSQELRAGALNGILHATPDRFALGATGRGITLQPGSGIPAAALKRLEEVA